MKPWAVVPVKRFSLGKSRLGAVLDAPARLRLAHAMFDRVVGEVLCGLARGGEIGGVLVLSDGEDVIARAHQRGCSARLSAAAGPGRPLSIIVDEGLQYLTERGAEAALVIMGDLPALEPDDVRRLAALLAEHDVVIAPDEAGAGVNALAMRLPPPMPTRFRGGDSLEDHLAEARARGLGLVLCDRQGLRFDLDRPSDYERLAELS